MHSRPKITNEDLFKRPEYDYANFEGENRVFTIFCPISPKMAKLKEGREFEYEGRLYQIKIKVIEGVKLSQIIKFNCLEVSKTQPMNSKIAVRI